MELSRDMEKGLDNTIDITKSILTLLLKILSPIQLERDYRRENADKLFEDGWTRTDRKNDDIFGIVIPASENDRETRNFISVLKDNNIPYFRGNDGNIVVPAFCPFDRALGNNVEPTQADYENFIKEALEECYDINVKMPSEEIDKILSEEINTPNLEHNFDISFPVSFDKMSGVMSLDSFKTTDENNIANAMFDNLETAGFEVNRESRTIDFSSEGNLEVLAQYMEMYRNNGYDSRNLTDILNRIVSDVENVPFTKFLVNEDRESRTNEANERLKINPMDKSVYEEFRNIASDNSWEFDVTRRAEELYLAKETEIDEDDLEDIDEFERENTFSDDESDKEEKGNEDKEDEDLPNPDDILLEEIDEENEGDAPKKKTNEEFLADMEAATRAAYDEEIILREQLDDIARRQSDMERNAQYQIAYRQQLADQLERQQNIGRELEIARLTRQLEDNARELQRINLEASRLEAQQVVAEAEYANHREAYNYLYNDSAAVAMMAAYEQNTDPREAYINASNYYNQNNSNIDNGAYNQNNSGYDYNSAYNQNNSGYDYNSAYSQNNSGYDYNSAYSQNNSGYDYNSAYSQNNSGYDYNSAYNQNNSGNDYSNSYNQTGGKDYSNTYSTGYEYNSDSYNHSNENSSSAYNHSTVNTDYTVTNNQSTSSIDYSNVHSQGATNSNNSNHYDSGFNYNSDTFKANQTNDINSGSSYNHQHVKNDSGNNTYDYAGAGTNHNTGVDYHHIGNDAGNNTFHHQPVRTDSGNSTINYGSIGTNHNTGANYHHIGNDAGNNTFHHQPVRTDSGNNTFHHQPVRTDSGNNTFNHNNIGAGSGSGANYHHEINSGNIATTHSLRTSSTFYRTRTYVSNTVNTNYSGNPLHHNISGEAGRNESRTPHHLTSNSGSRVHFQQASTNDGSSRVQNQQGSAFSGGSRAHFQQASTHDVESRMHSQHSMSESHHITREHNSSESTTYSGKKGETTVVDKAHDNYAGSLYAAEVKISKAEKEAIKNDAAGLAKNGVPIPDNNSKYSKEKTATIGGGEAKTYKVSGGSGMPEGGKGYNWGSQLPQDKQRTGEINTKVAHFNPFEGSAPYGKTANQVLAASVSATTAVVTKFGLAAVEAGGVDANKIRMAGNIGKDIAGSMVNACRNSSFIGAMKDNGKIDAKNRLHSSIQNSLSTVCNNDNKYMNATNKLAASKYEKAKLAGGAYSIYQMNAMNEKINKNQASVNARRSELAKVTDIEKAGAKKYIGNNGLQGKKDLNNALDAIEKDARKGKITEAEALKLKVALNNEVAESKNFKVVYKKSTSIRVVSTAASIGIAGAAALTRSAVKVSAKIVGESEDIRTLKNSLAGGRRVVRAVRKTRRFTRKGFNACAEVARLRGNKNALSVRIQKLELDVKGLPKKALTAVGSRIGRMKPVRTLRTKANRKMNSIRKRESNLHEKMPIRRARVALGKKFKNTKLGKALSKVNAGRKAAGKVAGKVINVIFSPAVLLKKIMQIMQALCFKVMVILGAIVAVALGLQVVMEALTGSWAAIYDAAEAVASYSSKIEDVRLDTPFGTSSLTMEAMDVVYYQAPRLLRGLYGTVDKIFDGVENGVAHFGWIGRRAADKLDELEDDAAKTAAGIKPDEEVVIFTQPHFTDQSSSTWYTNYTDYASKDQIVVNSSTEKLLIYDLFDGTDNVADTSLYVDENLTSPYSKYRTLVKDSSTESAVAFGENCFSLPHTNGDLPNGIYYLYDTAFASLDEAEAYIIYVDEKGIPCGKISNVKQILSMTSIVFEDYSIRESENNVDVEGDPSVSKSSVGLGSIFELFEFFVKVRDGARKIVADAVESKFGINLPDWIFDSSAAAQTLSMVAYSTSAYLTSHDIYMGYAVTDGPGGKAVVSLAPCQGRKSDNTMFGAHYDGSGEYEMDSNNMCCKYISITRSEPWVFKTWSRAALSQVFYNDKSRKWTFPDYIKDCIGDTKYKYSINISDKVLRNREKELFEYEYADAPGVKENEYQRNFSFTSSKSKLFSPQNRYRGSLAVLKNQADKVGGFSTTNATGGSDEWPGIYLCHSYVDYCLKWAVGTRAFDRYGVDTLKFGMCPGHPQVCVYLQIFTFGTDTGMGENEDKTDPKHPKSGTYNLFDKVESNPFCKNFEVFMSKNGEFKNNWNSYEYEPSSTPGTASSYKYDKTTITNNDYKACFN